MPVLVVVRPAQTDGDAEVVEVEGWVADVGEPDATTGEREASLVVNRHPCRLVVGALRCVWASWREVGVDERSRTVGVALSGGGHRAALWGLGALLYLVDAGKGPSIGCVSSVSGGSLTNAWVGLTVDLETVTADDFRSKARRVARAAATHGTLWASWVTYAYLALGAIILVVAAILSMQLEGLWLVPVWTVALLVVAWLGVARGRVCAIAFERTLFEKAQLEHMQTSVDHVICACDLQSAEALFLSGRFACSYRHGWGEPGGLRLARAVQASASLPGAFPSAFLSARRHGFVDGEHQGVRHLKLTDGGVYDNMATEWPTGVERRNKQWAAHDPRLRAPQELVGVNASAGLGWTPRRSLRLPLVGEVMTLLAVKDVLYDQTTAVRRRALLRRFWLAELGPDAHRREPVLDGVLVQINRSPFEIADSFASGSDDKAERAQALLNHIADEDRPTWAQITRDNAAVKTTLSSVGRERAALLLRHAYALTMAMTHIVLGYPVRPLPSLDDLEAWVS
jgi:predicted acylesterase/phospholipase RssA